MRYSPENHHGLSQTLSKMINNRMTRNEYAVKQSLTHLENRLKSLNKNNPQLNDPDYPLPGGLKLPTHLGGGL